MPRLVGGGLEGLEADAAHRVDERLAAAADVAPRVEIGGDGRMS
ncbi:hypothetical protein [Burkholderia ubonensis]|nr:hypothetical protein [Burkholderia ubonensis]